MIAAATGLAAPRVGDVSGGRVTASGLRPDLLLVAAGPGEGEGILKTLEQAAAAASGLVTVTDVTHGRFEYRIVGPEAPRLLSKLCGLDFDDDAFPDRRCRETSVARVKALVVRASTPAAGPPGASSAGAPRAPTFGRSSWRPAPSSASRPSAPTPSESWKPESKLHRIPEERIMELRDVEKWVKDERHRVLPLLFRRNGRHAQGQAGAGHQPSGHGRRGRRLRRLRRRQHGPGPPQPRAGQHARLRPGHDRALAAQHGLGPRQPRGRGRALRLLPAHHPQPPARAGPRSRLPLQRRRRGRVHPPQARRGAAASPPAIPSTPSTSPATTWSPSTATST